jgi:hypothetical protein
MWVGVSKKNSKIEICMGFVYNASQTSHVRQHLEFDSIHYEFKIISNMPVIHGYGHT